MGSSMITATPMRSSRSAGCHRWPHRPAMPMPRAAPIPARRRLLVPGGAWVSGRRSGGSSKETSASTACVQELAATRPRRNCSPSPAGRTVARLTRAMGLPSIVRRDARPDHDDPRCVCTVSARPGGRCTVASRRRGRTRSRGRWRHPPLRGRIGRGPWIPNRTYVSTWHGFVQVVIVIDARARRIVGSRVAHDPALERGALERLRRPGAGASRAPPRPRRRVLPSR